MAKKGKEKGFDYTESSFLVPFDGDFSVKKAKTSATKGPDDDACKDELKKVVRKMADLQEVLYADDRYSLLCVFQAMDAAGKDSTIRKVFSGVNPAGFEVHSFKKPSSNELDHDFLWRTARSLPQRGRIGVFNRSYYEETLVVKVHPELLAYQRLPLSREKGNSFWEARYESIRDHEKHLARNGTVVLKFWLNVSREEQKARFLRRIDLPEKNWKFEKGDVVERGYWDDYMAAYEDALQATSCPWAPWYAIPADSKPYMRLAVARIILQTLERLPIAFPKVDGEEQKQLAAYRSKIEQD
ncbi:MAG: PPK2 family polyphosphate kinase [Verrucomicrobiota bacterium]